MRQVTSHVWRGGAIDLSAPIEQPNHVSYVLNLQSDALGDVSVLRECLHLEKLGMKSYAHPLSGIVPPSLDELKIAADLIKRCDKPGVGIYVHCKHGVDRTGMVIAAHRILNEDWEPWDAMFEMLNEGFHWCYLYWIPQLWRLK